MPEARCARLSDMALAVAAAAYQRTLVPSGGGGIVSREIRMQLELSQFQETDFNIGNFETLDE